MMERGSGNITADSATLYVYQEDGTALKSAYRQVQLTLDPGTYYFVVKIYNNASAHKSIIHVEAEEIEEPEEPEQPEEPEKVIAVKLSYLSTQKTFTYGDGTWSVSAQITEDGSAVTRSVRWEYPDTDAYDFKVSSDKKTLSVTPKRATTGSESFKITAKDTISGKQASVALKTACAALDKKDTNGKNIYIVSAIADQKWTGKQVCPAVTVKNGTTQKTLGTSDYQVKSDCSCNRKEKLYRNTHTVFLD